MISLHHYYKFRQSILEETAEHEISFLPANVLVSAGEREAADNAMRALKQYRWLSHFVSEGDSVSSPVLRRSG